MAIAALAASACLVTTVTGSANGDNVTQLKNRLNSAQSQLNGAKQRQQTLSGSVTALDRRVTSLGAQISLVQSREAAARERLATYEQRLAAIKDALVRERDHLAHLHKVLDRAQSGLKAELVSEYEQPQQSVVSLLVDSSGVQQLVNGLEYLSRAKHQEQSIISVTRTARAKAQTAAARLTTLQHGDAQAAGQASTQTDALAGMNALLNSQQGALADERAAQTAALAASRERGAQLQATISTIQKQETAAEAAARTVTYAAGDGLGASGGWAIPYPIVLCESGGQDLPPNSAGASGYYQIMPATWSDFGGTGAAAYLAPKSEQDAVAARIWNNGAGASNWTCAGIAGIS